MRDHAERVAQSPVPSLHSALVLGEQRPSSAAFGRVESGAHTRASYVEAQTAVVHRFLACVLDCTIQAATFRVRSTPRLE